MIGLDTNVLIRYIVQDDPVQSKKATALIESLSDEATGYVTLMSVVELVWVLQGSYLAAQKDVVDVLETLLRTRTLVIEQADTVLKALRVFATSTADFADCVIEMSANAAGCEWTATFDKKVAKVVGMRLIG